MTKNMGGADRLIRAALGLVLVGAALFVPQFWWGWAGVVLLLTAASGWCPLYAPFGLKTCKDC